MENEIGSFICDFYYRVENIGISDIKDFMVGLKENISFIEFDFSNNCIIDRTVFGKGIGEILKVSVILFYGNILYRIFLMLVFFYFRNKILSLNWNWLY